MINLLPIGKAIWDYSRPAIEVAGQVLIGVGTVIAASKVVDGIGDGINYLRGRNAPTPKKRVQKRKNTKSASGNRKTAGKKATKKVVHKPKAGIVGEKTPAVTS